MIAQKLGVDINDLKHKRDFIKKCIKERKGNLSSSGSKSEKPTEDDIHEAAIRMISKVDMEHTTFKRFVKMLEDEMDCEDLTSSEAIKDVYGTGKLIDAKIVQATKKLAKKVDLQEISNHKFFVMLQEKAEGIDLRPKKDLVYKTLKECKQKHHSKLHNSMHANNISSSHNRRTTNARKYCHSKPEKCAKVEKEMTHDEVPHKKKPKGDRSPYKPRKYYNVERGETAKVEKETLNDEVPYEKRSKSSSHSREYPAPPEPRFHASISIHDDTSNFENQNGAANESNGTTLNQECQEEAVGNGVGCCIGFLRDRHSGVAICTILFITFGALYSANVLSSSTCVNVCFVAGAFYLYFACKSNTFKYLWNVVTTETAMEYIYRMYNAAPEICWHIQCYHMEKRIRYVEVRYTSSYTDSSGRTVQTVHYATEPEEYWVRVNTHSANGKLHYIGWKEVSIPVKQESIEEHRLTKVLVNRYWRGDSGAHAQKSDFINFNNRDVSYDFTETLIIPGYRKRFMGLNDINDRPFLLHWMWYILSHLTVVFAYPFLMYASSISDKVEVDIIKQVWTVVPSPYGNNDGKMTIPPYSSQTKREGKKPRRCCWCVGFIIYTAGIGVLAYYVTIRAIEEAGIKVLYPGCTDDMLSLIGNGICDGGEYNTEQCGWDGGDCILYDYPECHVNSLSLIGDGK